MLLEHRGVHYICTEEGKSCYITIYSDYVFRYEDRWRYLQSVTSNTVKCCYEEFAQSVMHPLQTGIASISRHSPVKPLLSSSSVYHQQQQPDSISSSSKLSKISSLPLETRWNISSSDTTTVKGSSNIRSKESE